MATRSAQWHPSYNPVTHTGQGEPAAAAHDRPRGVKITPKPATLSSNLVGAACIPAGGSPAACASPPAQASPTQAQYNPARVDHLLGGGCTPSSSTDEASQKNSSPGRQHGTGRASPKASLRAAVDHMHGGACAVQAVRVVATHDAPPPQLQRGMATKLTKDRMLAQQTRNASHGEPGPRRDLNSAGTDQLLKPGPGRCRPRGKLLEGHGSSGHSLTVLLPVVLSNTVAAPGHGGSRIAAVCDLPLV